MTRSLSSNLVKGGYISVAAGDKLTIDNNEFDHSDKSEVNVTTTTVSTVSEPAVTARQLVTAEPDSVVFYSSGYGHGVGMSQNAAKRMAMEGRRMEEILGFFYTDCHLAKLY